MLQVQRRPAREVSQGDAATLAQALQSARRRALTTTSAQCNTTAAASSLLHRTCAMTSTAWWAPARASQPESSSSGRLSLITMVKDANALLREWVPYHLLLGVSHFYIVNNDCGESATSYSSCEGLRRYIDAGLVTFLDPEFRCRRIGRAVLLGALIDELARPQSSAAAQSAREHEWVLEVDPDEYLVLPPRARVPDFLRTHATRFDSVPLPWRIFGTSFRANATREGTVIANYRLRMPLALTFESIVELVERQKAKDQVHPFLFKEMVRVSALGDARRCRDAHGAHGHQCTHTLDWVAQRPASKPDAQLKWVELRANGSNPTFPVVTASEEQAPMPAAAAAAFIHHYTFLSEEEWERKKLRGRPRKGTKFARRQGGVDRIFSAVYDTTLTDRLKLLSDDAERWSARPALARRCATALRRGDKHFYPLTNGAVASALLNAEEALDDARTQRATRGPAARVAAARWFLERWAQSGHESRAPMVAAQALGMRGNASRSSSLAARWLLARWNGTLGVPSSGSDPLGAEERQLAAAAIASVVGAFPTECAEESGACAGWTTLDAERV